MIARFHSIGLLFVLLFGGISSAQAEDASKWLQQMSAAMKSLNYTGRFVYLHDNVMESMQLVHAITPDGERERLFSLNGAGREVLRDRDLVTCILPDAKKISVDTRSRNKVFPSLSESEIRALGEFYQFRVLGKDRVAGRPVVVVGVLPRDKMRYGYRLYLDSIHALPLKTDLIDHAGAPLVQIMFTSLNIMHSIPLESLEPSTRGNHFTWQYTPTSRKDSDGPRVSPASPVPGYALVSSSARSEGGKSLEHLVFSDGLASVSVYVEEAQQENGLTGHSSMGAVNAYGRQHKNFQVTAVGEVPSEAVAQFVESIQFKLASR